MARTPKALPPGTAWAPPPYEIADAAAIQALMRGGASEDQQKRALDWIINVGAGTYDMSYRPGGEEGNRDTVFAEGRRFVGSQIVKLSKLNLSRMTKGQPGEQQ